MIVENSTQDFLKLNTKTKVLIINSNIKVLRVTGEATVLHIHKCNIEKLEIDMHHLGYFKFFNVKIDSFDIKAPYLQDVAIYFSTIPRIKLPKSVMFLYILNSADLDIDHLDLIIYSNTTRPTKENPKEQDDLMEVFDPNKILG